MKKMTFNGAASVLNEKEMQNVMAGSGWWDSWGRCTAGVVGGGALGSLLGGFFGKKGVVVGIVGGALTGAAEFC